MTAAPRRHTLTIALIVAVVSTCLVASVGSLTAWVMTILVAFGPSIVALHSWKELAQTTTQCLQEGRGAAATAVSMSRWNRRRRARNIGWMSAQWLEEHRAAGYARH